MNVILTVNYSPWSAYSGGGQRSTHNLAIAYHRRGHDVTVVYTKPPWERVEVPEDLPYEVEWATFFGVSSRRAAPLRPLNAFSVAQVVRRLVTQTDAPVVIHCNGEEGALLPTLRPDVNFGLVATPRYSEYPPALMKGDSMAPWTWVRLACTEPKYLAQGRIARNADRCVPPSAYAARMLQQAYDVPEERLDVVHNGVPREFLTYKHDPAALEDGPLVFFGRFADHKGVDVFVEALGRLDDDGPDALIIGRGPRKEELHQQVRRLGLEDRVSFHPWMTHHELGATLEQAQMVALPSRQENFSLAILSAMAVGVPTISTRVGGTPEIIDDEKTGMLVPSDDALALADAIASLHRNPEKARRLGEAGRTHVRNHLTWEDAAQAFESLFEEILSERELAIPTS